MLNRMNSYTNNITAVARVTFLLLTKACQSISGFSDAYQFSCTPQKLYLA